MNGSDLASASADEPVSERRAPSADQPGIKTARRTAKKGPKVETEPTLASGGATAEPSVSVPPLPPAPDAQPATGPSSAVPPPEGVPKRAAGLLDLERLRLNQNFAAQLGVKKALLKIPVMKPNRQAWVQVHPSAEYRLETAVLELKDEREVYLVDPGLWSELAGEIVPVALFTTVTRQAVVSLWPIRLPGEDGKLNEWHASALEAAQLAMKGWVRVAANMSLKGYDVFHASESLAEPAWPKASFQELIDIAFKGRFIASLDHSVVRTLLGRS